MIFVKVWILQNINEIEQNFANSKNVHELKKKNVRNLQNSLLIYKIFTYSKKIMNFKNCSPIQEKWFKKCS